MTLVEGGSFTQAQRDSLAERFSDENGLLVEFELEPFCLGYSRLHMASFSSASGAASASRASTFGSHSCPNKGRPNA